MERRATWNDGGFTQWVWQHCNNLNYSELGLYWFTAGSAYLLHLRRRSGRERGTVDTPVPRKSDILWGNGRQDCRGERIGSWDGRQWILGRQFKRDPPLYHPWHCCKVCDPNLLLFLHHNLALTPTSDLDWTCLEKSVWHEEERLQGSHTGPRLRPVAWRSIYTLVSG